jgi:hypothetical protein
MADLDSVVCSPWADTADVCAPCADYEADQALLEKKLLVASELLFAWSGHQYPGVCSDIVRPCARYDGSDVGMRSSWGGTGGWGYGFGGAGLWQSSWGFCSCNRTRRSGCQSIPEITLGAYPVIAVSEVKVDGAALDASRYRVDDDRWLVRLPDADGSRPGFPCCQDMVLPDTEENTFFVAFTYGQVPPLAGVAAAAALGCELTLACDPETASECRLDWRVQSITRQGVSEVLIIGRNFREHIELAIPEVGMFLAAANPNGIERRATVMSPDIGRRVRRTGA